MKTALVSGATGQDGSYLLEFLLDKGYKVIGIQRCASTTNTQRINHLIGHKNLELIEGEVTDLSNVNSWFKEFDIDECYNLAAQSHVGTSFKQPKLTWAVNAEGAVNILEAIKTLSKHTKFYQASTSEMFGKNYTEHEGRKFQNELTQFAPQSPYGVSKVAAHESAQMYRDAYGLYSCSGILFNHESERRGDNFVTRKITRWIGELDDWQRYYLAWGKVEFLFNDDSICAPKSVKDKFPKLRLGNIDAHRDWGHAEDYVRAMWLMLQQETPEDYVICTGRTHTVEDFLVRAFKEIDIENFYPYMVQDPEFMRPAEVDYLCGDSSKAKEMLGWEPKVTFEELIKRMVNNDLKKEKKKVRSQ